MYITFFFFPLTKKKVKEKKMKGCTLEANHQTGFKLLYILYILSKADVLPPVTPTTISNPQSTYIGPQVRYQKNLDFFYEHTVCCLSQTFLKILLFEIVKKPKNYSM